MFKNWLITEENKKSKIKKIDIFDFDGTLIFTPNENKSKEILEKHNKKAKEKGEKELDIKISDDFYMSPISLEPPFVPIPTPCIMLNQDVAQQFYKSQNDPNCLTILMTGRGPTFKTHIDRILNDFKLIPDRIYLMPETKEKTVDKKIQHIARLLDEFPKITEIEMWDDRGLEWSKLKQDPSDNHIKEFKKFLAICKYKRLLRNKDWDLKIKINEITPQA